MTVARIRTAAKVLRLGLFAILTTHAVSQTTNSTNEFWPEADVFLTVHPNVRLILTAKRERDVEFLNTETGGAFEVSFHRFLPALNLPWRDQDATRRTLISIGAGYKYKRSFGTEPPVHENRAEMNLTLRWVLHQNILVSSRSRWEGRFVSDAPFSWRFRDQLKLEKDFKLDGQTFTTYIAAEPFYDARTSKWDRFRLSCGAVFPIGRRFAAEPYYLRQRVTNAEPRFTNAVGLVLQVHQAINPR